jgi:hypothetical protein
MAAADRPVATGLARRDYGRDWIGEGSRSTIFDSESEMLCGREGPSRLFQRRHPQLAESSDDEASRRKIPPESAIATSVSNRKPRLAEPREAVLFALSCSSHANETAGAMMASPFSLARRGAAEMLVPDRRSVRGFYAISIWVGVAGSDHGNHPSIRSTDCEQGRLDDCELFALATRKILAEPNDRNIV